MKKATHATACSITSTLYGYHKRTQTLHKFHSMKPAIPNAFRKRAKVQSAYS